MNYTILGYGDRGALYAELFAKEGAALNAVCEMRSERLESAGKLYNLPKEKLFFSYKDFAAAGKLGELCVIATQDEQHSEHSLAMLEAGYDLLLEKPSLAPVE